MGKKTKNWKVERLHCQFRKVEKSKSGRVSFSISKSRKVEKWAGFILNFEKLKSRRKVEMLQIEFRKVEKPKSPFFHFPKRRICQIICVFFRETRILFPFFHFRQRRVVQIHMCFPLLVSVEINILFPFFYFLKHPVVDIICAVLKKIPCGK